MTDVWSLGHNCKIQVPVSSVTCVLPFHILVISQNFCSHFYTNLNVLMSTEIHNAIYFSITPVPMLMPSFFP